MDPNACLARLIDAWIDSDRDEVRAAYEDYNAWRKAGGFAATIHMGGQTIEIDAVSFAGRVWTLIDTDDNVHLMRDVVKYRRTS